MAKLESYFDPNEVPADTEYSLIPNNEVVTAVLEKTDIVPNSKGTGTLLKLAWVVIDGKFEGRKLFSSLNLTNPNPKAVQIANRELADITLACGKKGLEDSDDLLGIPVALKVVIEPEGQYPACNKIKNYRPVQAKALESFHVKAGVGPWAKKS